MIRLLCVTVAPSALAMNDKGSDMVSRRRSPAYGIGAGAILAVALAACSSPVLAATATARGLPAKVAIYSIQDLSGPAATPGLDDERGDQLAVADINREKFLGSTKLTISFGDSATDPTTAAAVASRVATAHDPIVIGPPASSSAVAVAPIMAKAGQPTIFTQAGSAGVLVSPDIYRLTTLQTSLYPLVMKWLGAQKVKTVAVIQDSDIPTDAELTSELKADGATYGFKVVGVESVLAAQSNIASAMSSVLTAHAQALALNVITTQNATAATLAQQGGFSGPIIAEEGAANDVLAPAGSAANGIVWASDWMAGAPGQMSAIFTREYEAAYHAAPSNWAAESYDAVWFAARGLKQADSTSPAKVQAALTSVGTAGFTGVLGKITVVGGQEKTKPLLISWKNGSQSVMANQNP
jgi:branched-chain amino acid transport system substrate-binding protein